MFRPKHAILALLLAIMIGVSAGYALAAIRYKLTIPGSIEVVLNFDPGLESTTISLVFDPILPGETAPEKTFQVTNIGPDDLSQLVVSSPDICCGLSLGTIVPEGGLAVGATKTIRINVFSQGVTTVGVHTFDVDVDGIQ